MQYASDSTLDFSSKLHICRCSKQMNIYVDVQYILKKLNNTEIDIINKLISALLNREEKLTQSYLKFR